MKDFGGQKVYYSTHIFFLSERALYVIVWNVTKEGEKERILFWASTIQSLVSNPLIILVGTHLDQVPISEADRLYNVYAEISEQTKIPLQNMVSISCSTGKNFEYLIKLLVRSSLSLPMIGKIFPQYYLDFKEKLQEEAKLREIPIIEWRELVEIGKQCSIVGKEELKKAIEFLHVLGFCLHFPKDQVLKKYIVIHPQWLANTMATLISTKSVFISKKKGILDHQHLQTVWKEYSPAVHKLLLQFMEKFHVAIPFSGIESSNLYEGQSVIPALLSDVQPPEVLTSWDVRLNRLKRLYQFHEVFPVDLFPRLSASLLLAMGIRKTRFWKDGIIVFEEDSKALISVQIPEKGILLCFSGNQWFALFRKVKLLIEMLLNKWEQLTISKYVVCTSCSQSEPLLKWSHCFDWKECYESFYESQMVLECKKSQKVDKIVNLIPEMIRSEISKVPRTKITLLEKIGEGSFAHVYRGEYRKQEVAVKQLKSGVLDNQEEELRRFFQETELLHNHNHPNLLGILAMVLSPPWLIFPFAKYGSLYDHLHIIKGNWMWPLPLRTAFDIASGLHYLHTLELPIIHCDLRTPNILIFSLNYRDQVIAKLADFGISQYSLGRVLIQEKKRRNPSKKKIFFFLFRRKKV